MEIVQQWMSTPVLSLTSTTVLPEARRVLQKQQIRRAPVIDAAGALVGIVTEGDINRISDSHVTDVRDFNLYHRIADLPVRDFMTRSVVTVTPETPMTRVAELLQRHRIGGLPVIVGSQVVGMITEYDVCSCLIAALQPAYDTGR